MAWNLTATGDIQAERGSAAHAVEEQLLAELRAVLAKPEYGTVGTFLRGTHVVTTTVHVPEPEQPDTAGDAEPQPAAPARPGRSAKG